MPGQRVAGRRTGWSSGARGSRRRSGGAGAGQVGGSFAGRSRRGGRGGGGSRAPVDAHESYTGRCAWEGQSADRHRSSPAQPIAALLAVAAGASSGPPRPDPPRRHPGRPHDHLSTPLLPEPVGCDRKRKMSLDESLAPYTAKHPRNDPSHVQYGTAGFRMRSEKLDHVLYRMGILAVLRSRVKKAAIGVMITASHNPEEDNGVKLIDPLGEMLEQSWEAHATAIVNASDGELASVINDLVRQHSISMDLPAEVFVGHDTRPSCASLLASCLDGISALGAEGRNYGLLTTPQLHYIVRAFNTRGEYGDPTEEGYYDKLSSAFTRFARLQQELAESSYSSTLVIDGANGVGAPKWRELVRRLPSDLLHATLINDGTSGRLNHDCGADFVKVQQKPPAGMSLVPGTRYASFDGDADRIVYYYASLDGAFHLLDGDKIATLVAGHIMSLTNAAGLKLAVGLVQTAYANGSSTDYITNKLGVEAACVATGVKHLHHKALEFDIGVYFEANGHGTVIFSSSAESAIRHLAGHVDGNSANSAVAAARQLAALIDVINQAVGDAISDLLLVESVLLSKGWNVAQWDEQYTDLPSRQLKVQVKDRNLIQTTNAERVATHPAGLQDAIDGLVAKYKNGRAFVRPSGTEDVVRIYAEASTQEAADLLAYHVAMAAYDMACGVGPKPVKPALCDESCS